MRKAISMFLTFRTSGLLNITILQTGCRISETFQEREITYMLPPVSAAME
jgi:hypothetical protein